MALSWVRSHSYNQGEPNMISAEFFTWVNSILLLKVLEKYWNTLQKSQNALHTDGFIG